MVDEATLNRARADVVVSIEIWRKLIGERHSDVALCRECDILYQELFCGIPVKNIRDAVLFFKELWSSRRV